MQRLAPTLALSLFLLFNLSTSAQENKVPDDSSAVRATVTNYIEAYYTGDARRMEAVADDEFVLVTCTLSVTAALAHSASASGRRASRAACHCAIASSRLSVVTSQ